MPSRSRIVALLGALSLAALVAAPASAATPGKNGKVVWMNDGDVVVTDLAGTLPSDGTVIVPAAQHPVNPRWSPDGTRIAYNATDVDNHLQVFVVNADGTGQRQVTHVCGAVVPDWTPDGQWIVFGESACDNGSERISRIRVDGTGLAAVTPFKDGRFDDGPIVSPDGRIVSFDTGDLAEQLIFADPFKPASDAKNRKTWSSNAYYQSFSPDGKRIAYGYEVSATTHFAIRKVAGGPATKITAGNFLEFTPDGVSLVYSVDTGSGYQVWMKRADMTGTPVKIGPATGDSTSAPTPHVQPLCSIKGNGKANTLNGTAKSELICGFGGNDTIDGKGGLDIILAGPGNDTIKGGPGNDVLLGEGGNDRIDGGTGIDRCVQGPGKGPLTSC
ncbi:MAG: hypothetical protein U0869_19460 [Chloroflexota bacterium]